MRLGSARGPGVAGLVAVCLFLPAIGSRAAPVQASTSVSLQQLVLRQSDMPRGFRTGVHQSIDNRIDAVRNGIKVAQLSKHGRLSGYEASFGRYVTSSSGFVVDSVVTAFTSVSGAQWYYRRILGHARHTGSTTVPLHVRIGDEGEATAVGSIAYTILFRRGPLVATVTEASTSTRLKVPPSTVIHYAQVVDQRIRAHT